MSILKPNVLHYSPHHVGSLESQVTIFGQEVEAREDTNLCASILIGSDCKSKNMLSKRLVNYKATP